MGFGDWVGNLWGGGGGGGGLSNWISSWGGGGGGEQVPWQAESQAPAPIMRDSYDIPDMGSGAEGIAGGAPIATGGGAGSAGMDPASTGLSRISDYVFSLPKQGAPGPGGQPGPTQGGTLLGDLSRVSNQLTPLMKLGAGGMGIANMITGQQQMGRMTKLAEQSARRQNAIGNEAMQTANPLQKFSGSEITNVTNRTLPAGTEAEIEQWTRDAKQKAASYFAGAGQGNSSSMFQMNAWIDNLAQQMREKAFTEMATRGTNAAGTAGNILGAGAGAYGGGGAVAVNQQQGLQNLIGEANRVIAQMGAQ